LKERLVTLVLAIGALALCYALMLPKPPREGQAPPRPLSTEPGPSGYQAAWRWLKSGRVPVAALHERYDSLNANDKSAGSTGNLLLTTLPHKLPVRLDEASQLDAWVERGNTLVVAAALDDTPRWALADGATLLRDVGRLTRLKLEVVDPKSRTLDSAFGAPFNPKVIRIEPRGAHPLMEGVHSIHVESDLPASRWRATPMDQAGVLQIGQVAGNNDAAIWIRAQGKGQVILFAVAGLFSDRDLGTGDNAKLLSNTIAWALGPGGAVIFDDAHQGVVSYYDSKVFFADPRLHRTIAWLLFLWFVFVLGIQRLGIHLNEWHPVEVTAFISASGQFFASTLTPVAVGSRLMVNFFNAIRRRLGEREDGAPLWEWLSLQAAVLSGDLAELRRLYERIQAGRRVDLRSLQNLLSRLQGKIT